MLGAGPKAGSLGFGQAIADAPKSLGLRFARGDHRIRDQSALNQRENEPGEQIV